MVEDLLIFMMKTQIQAIIILALIQIQTGMMMEEPDAPVTAQQNARRTGCVPQVKPVMWTPVLVGWETI
jgi:hypothetical protein